MENNGSIGDMFFRREDKRDKGRVFVPICRGRTESEIMGDFSLPEYMPEIRKLLKIFARVSPPAKYLSANSVKLSGEVSYTALYVGGDGRLHSYIFTDGYEMGAAFSPDAEYDINGSISLCASVTPDSLTGRVTGARKMNVKCRLCADVSAYGSSLVFSEGGVPSDTHIQRLVKSSECIACLFGENRDVEVVDEFVLEDQSESYVSTDCRVFIESVSTFDGYAECSGSVNLRHLVAKANGEVYSIPHKVSFSEVVEVNELSASASATAYGECTEVIFSAELMPEREGAQEVSVRARLCLNARGYEKSSVEYVKDCFSTERECQNEMQSVELSKLYAAANKNMTVSESVDVAELGVLNESADITVVESYCDPTVEGVELGDSGKYVINGKCRFDIIYSQKDANADEMNEDAMPEYYMGELVLPFRYECSEGGYLPERSFIKAEAISPKARINGSRIDLGCELAIAYEIGGSEVISAVGACRLGEAYNKVPCGFTVCYPDESDSLWSISKKYRKTVASTAMKNNIDDQTDADLSKTLDGIRYMIV